MLFKNLIKRTGIIKVNDFEFARFREFRAEREENLRNFLLGKSSHNVFLKEVAFENYYCCRTPLESLELQLNAITRQMDLKSGYVPYLEPWFGVGVYANAFGAEYVWPPEGVQDSPQTHYVALTEEDVANLPEPSIENSPIMKLVIDAIDYFVAETKGEIPISCTDTQSPIDNATLIWDTSSFFTAMYTSPDLVHEFLAKITSLMIEFTELQIRHLGGTWARPGHIMMASTNGPGLSLSDDNIVMVSASHYAEFAARYNGILADKFGGVAIHSCGCYRNQLKALIGTRGIIMIDGAFSKSCNPTPNTDYEFFRDSLKGTGIILQARMGNDWKEILPRLYHPDLRLVLSIPGPQKGESPSRNILELEKLLETL